MKFAHFLNTIIKHTQTIRRLWPFCRVGTQRVNLCVIGIYMQLPSFHWEFQPGASALASDALTTASYTYHISLQQGRYFRKICFFFKIYKNQCRKYLFDIIRHSNCQYRNRNEHNILHINLEHHYSKNLYFLSTMIEWYN